MTNEAFYAENFSCSMFAKDLKGLYIWVNQALLAKHNLKAKDILGKADKDLPWELHAKLLRTHDIEVMDSGSPIVFKEIASRKGTLVRGLCHKAPALNKEGKLIGLTGVWFDAPRSLSFLSGLSIREKQCLEDIVSGKTAQESACRLGLSRRTVENYIDTLKNKLQCKSKSELIIKYYESI